MDVLERIKRGYRAMGPGEPPDLLAMFHQDQPDPPEWVVDDTIHIMPSGEVVAMELFAGMLPAHWELIGVDLRRWDYYRKKARLVVTGGFRARRKGTWEVVKLPFIHIWSLGEDDQVRGVFDYLGGIEVKRREDVESRRGLRFWRRAA